VAHVSVAKGVEKEAEETRAKETQCGSSPSPSFVCSPGRKETKRKMWMITWVAQGALWSIEFVTKNCPIKKPLQTDSCSSSDEWRIQSVRAEI
jgi:hypothetical protein